MNHRLKRPNQATHRISFNQLEYFIRRLDIIISLVTACTNFGEHFNSTPVGSLRSSGFLGQNGFGILRKLGPSSHIRDSLVVKTPLEARSAGLSSEGTCRHCFELVTSWMVAMRFATKVENLFDVLFR